MYNGDLALLGSYTTGSPGYGCVENDFGDDDMVPVCVPADGPMPLNAPQ